MHTKTDSGQIKFHFWQNQKYTQSAKTNENMKTQCMESIQ